MHLGLPYGAGPFNCLGWCNLIFGQEDFLFPAWKTITHPRLKITIRIRSFRFVFLAFTQTFIVVGYHHYQSGTLSIKYNTLWSGIKGIIYSMIYQQRGGSNSIFYFSNIDFSGYNLFKNSCTTFSSSKASSPSISHIVVVHASKFPKRFLAIKGFLHPVWICA